MLSACIKSLVKRATIPTLQKHVHHSAPSQSLLVDLFCCLKCALLLQQVQQEGKARLTCFVSVPKSAIRTGNEAGASSEGEGSSGGQGLGHQKGPTAPMTPPKKAGRAIPSSPTSSSTFAGAADLRFCQCCLATSKPCLCFHAI